MYTLFQWWTSWTYILHSFILCNKFNHMIIWDVEEAYHMNCLTLLLNKGVTGCSCINWRDTTHFDSEDDYRTGCRNISHCQQQQSYSGLRSPRRSNSTYFWIVLLYFEFSKNLTCLSSKLCKEQNSLAR